MRAFAYESASARVVFGPGAVDRVAAEAAALGARRVLLIADPWARAVAERIGPQLGDALVGVLDTVVQHVPEDLAEGARRRAADLRADAVVSVGGGSATGLAKAVAVASGAPIVAVPTTYAGSEATPVYGITGTHKVTARDRRAQPRVVVYDPELTVGMPPRLTATSGLNALAHAVQAPVAPTTNPISTMYALEAIRRLRAALPRAVRRGDDLDARAEALLGAYLAGTAFAGAGSGLHHRLCHVLGGDFGLVHADVHAVLLPYVVAYQQAVRPAAFGPVAAALGVTDAAAGLHDLAVDLGAPTSLAEIGMPADGLAAAAQRAATVLAGPEVRPPIDEARLRVLLGDAHAGRQSTLHR